MTEEEIQEMLDSMLGFEEKGTIVKSVIKAIRRSDKDKNSEGKLYQLMDIGEVDFTLIQTNASQGIIEDCWKEAWRSYTGDKESPLEKFLRDVVVEGYEVSELEIEDKIYTD